MLEKPQFCFQVILLEVIHENKRPSSIRDCDLGWVTGAGGCCLVCPSGDSSPDLALQRCGPDEVRPLERSPRPWKVGVVLGEKQGALGPGPQLLRRSVKAAVSRVAPSNRP